MAALVARSWAAARALDDVAQLDVLQLGDLEALGVVVEVLVDLALVDEVREELLRFRWRATNTKIGAARWPVLWSTMTLRLLISCD
jgi:hypothetical protein